MENIFNFDMSDYVNDETIKRMKEQVEKINNSEIDLNEILKKLNNKEEKKMTFEDALDLCDFEIKCRYDYLDELLCNIDDEIMYLAEEIERANIDKEVAEEMLDLGFEEARDKMIEANRERVELNKRLKYLEEKYEITMDLFDEVFLGILANIE